MKKIVLALPALLVAGSAMAATPAAQQASAHAKKVIAQAKHAEMITAPVSDPTQKPIVDKNVVDDQETTALNKVEDTKKHTKKHHHVKKAFKEGRSEETFTSCAIGEEQGKSCHSYQKTLKHAVPGMQPIVNPLDIKKWEKTQVAAPVAPVAPAAPKAAKVKK